MAVRSRSAVQALPFSQGHALALMWRLEMRARRRRWFAAPVRMITIVAALTLLMPLALAAAWPRLHEQTAALLALPHAHPFALGASAALAAFARMQAQRRRAERDHAASWLATAPIERHDVIAFLRWRAAATAVPLGAFAIAILATLGWLDERSVGDTGIFAGVGLIVGAIVGWRSGARVDVAAATPLPRLRNSESPSVATAGFAALRRWPFAQLLASANPRQHARIVAAVLLSLPMGIAPSVAVPILLLLATGLGAVALLQALLATIPRAADNLRSTPLPLPRWVVLLGARAFACEVVAAAFAAVLGCMLGASMQAALAGAAVWLLWVAFATLCAVAARHRPARLRGELFAFAVVLLALAAIAPPLLLVALPASAGWQAKRAWRA